MEQTVMEPTEARQWVSDANLRTLKALHIQESGELGLTKTMFFIVIVIIPS